MIFFGERSPRHALAETEIFYNRERAHQGLENPLIQPEFQSVVTDGEITCRSRLGEMLNFYYIDAA